MPFTVRSLADGIVPTPKNTLYQCATGLSTIVKTVTYVSVTSSPQTVNLYFRPTGGSTSRSLIPQDMALGGRFLLETDMEYTLEAGDVLEGGAGGPRAE